MSVQNYNQRGITVILVLVFTGAFGLSVLALTSFIFSQAQLGQTKEIREQALGAAEAGLQYYHWFLAHNPTDLQDGTGGAGPYVHTYSDPELGNIGNYSLDIVGNTQCGELQSIDITSTGTIDQDSRFKRTVYGRHAEPSVAEYAYIINSNVRAFSDREIYGPYHSNGGVVMNGTNNSLVTSAQTTWWCTYTGQSQCEPAAYVNGVIGDGPNSNLWEFPKETISFSHINSDFSALKSHAQTNGVYIAPYGYVQYSWSGNTEAIDGYRLVFQSDGTVDVYQIPWNYTWDYANYGYRMFDSTWGYDFFSIGNPSGWPTGGQFVATYAIPSDCSVIFVEDQTWIEGTVKGKVTVVAADVTNPGYDPDIILRKDINYTTADGSDGLTVIAERSVLISADSEDDLSLKGVFVAQNGNFGRNYYASDYGTQLTMQGSIVSNGGTATQWKCGGTVCSGYYNRDNTYDRLQTTNPPPFTPTTTSTPQYILWRENF